MKTLQANPAVLVVLLAVAFLFGCARKKPVLVMPQEQPSAAAPEPTPQPVEPQQPADSQAPVADISQNQPEKQEPDKGKTKRTKRRATAKKAPPAPAASGEKPVEVSRNSGSKQVIRDDKADPPPGSAQTSSSGQISPAPTPSDAAQDQATTEQLLQSAEAQLSGIKRQLSKDEEAILAQTKEFIAQSRKAATENDLVRAHNLAVKARLLSDELAKQH
jgi:hypothetical protein